MPATSTAVAREPNNAALRPTNLDSDGDHLLDFQDFMKLMTINNDDDLRKAFENVHVACGRRRTWRFHRHRQVSPRRVCNGCCSDLVLKAHMMTALPRLLHLTLILINDFFVLHYHWMFNSLGM
ncbi:hypothetical protein Ahy_B07g088624 [Arachis hypogaea]|uniref:EF-hand domain-containing protein n=1 Tax=Arachis hypogaea TaxID=3818 RepID=A0A444YEY8_ARAHY|nr:hypothetical protein Ahy_B07g088624 [Arachis hypogaea]